MVHLVSTLWLSERMWCRQCDIVQISSVLFTMYIAIASNIKLCFVHFVWRTSGFLQSWKFWKSEVAFSRPEKFRGFKKKKIGSLAKSWKHYIFGHGLTKFRNFIIMVNRVTFRKEISKWKMMDNEGKMQNPVNLKPLPDLIQIKSVQIVFVT